MPEAVVCEKCGATYQPDQLRALAREAVLREGPSAPPIPLVACIQCGDDLRRGGGPALGIIMSTVVDTLQARTKATEVRTDFLVALKDNKYGTAIGLALKEGGLRARLIIGFLAIGLALVLYLLVKVTLTLFR